MIIISTLHERIRQIRLNNKLTQKEMAHKLDISQGRLSDLESGNNLPSYETIIAICNEFDVSSEWLLFNNIIHSNLTSNEKKILDLYRALNDKDQIKIEGIMEEKLKEQFEQNRHCGYLYLPKHHHDKQTNRNLLYLINYFAL